VAAEAPRDMWNGQCQRNTFQIQQKLVVTPIYSEAPNCAHIPAQINGISLALQQCLPHATLTCEPFSSTETAVRTEETTSPNKILSL
jgi:hypothetical protein